MAPAGRAPAQHSGGTSSLGTLAGPVCRASRRHGGARQLIMSMNEAAAAAGPSVVYARVLGGFASDVKVDGASKLSMRSKHKHGCPKRRLRTRTQQTNTGARASSVLSWRPARCARHLRGQRATKCTHASTQRNMTREPPTERSSAGMPADADRADPM